MKSSIKIDTAVIADSNGEHIEPVLRIKLSPDESDLRDKILKTFFQNLLFEKSKTFTARWHGREYYSSLGEGENTFIDIDIYPSEEEDPYFYVHDNCDAFRKWLTTKGIGYADGGHTTGIPKTVNIFNLASEWGVYKDRNQPK